ncbi:flavodoxin family protein [Anaerosalibacter sp. Marseille-P3206]|uniref:flavodoxin family protein n=1 Tax=Anaerosalibacter sp. Marseille-P3206 TaxID=1871005 RepID=UPI000986EBCC|nr:flavodoxin family protein [Anaerosalibacter sp. Marseille-P3206]
MKTLIIYASIHHGNTEKIGRAMAETLNADIINVTDVSINELQNYDLIGFGSGIYGGKFHKTMFNLIEKLPSVANKKSFVFSTSSMEKKSYNKSIEEKLKEKGIVVIGSFSCKGYDTFGPFKFIGGIGKGRPNEEDIKKAQDFAEMMLRKLVS